jgi:hypothetical protein
VPPDWPGPLRDLAAKHGAAKVEEAAFNALGFPAGWVSTGTEIVAIREYLSVPF